MIRRTSKQLSGVQYPDNGQAKKEMTSATRKPTPPTSVSMMVQVLRVVFSSIPTRLLTGQQGDDVVQNGALGAFCQREGQRDEDDEAGVEEDRHGHHKAGDAQCLSQPLFRISRNQGVTH